MTNVEFCSQTCMAPATLSHILSERTRPTIAILRNIVEAFPDINPMWILLDQGEMYLTADSAQSTQQDGQADLTTMGAADDPDDVFGAFRTGLGGNDTSAASPRSSVQPSAIPAHGGGNVQSRTAQPAPVVPRVNVEEVVDLTLRRLQKPQRKVTEVRIFFDDGTYETFSAR